MDEERSDRLTPKQLLFLERLVQYQAREGVPPSVREMQALGGFRSPRSVAQFLDALQEAGYIDRAAGARNVRVLRRATGASLTDRTDTVRSDRGRTRLVKRITSKSLNGHNLSGFSLPD